MFHSPAFFFSYSVGAGSKRSSLEKRRPETRKRVFGILCINLNSPESDTNDVCAVGARDVFAASDKNDAAPCGRSDVMCSAFHARSAHHLRSNHHARRVHHVPRERNTSLKKPPPGGFFCLCRPKKSFRFFLYGLEPSRKGYGFTSEVFAYNAAEQIVSNPKIANSFFKSSVMPFGFCSNGNADKGSGNR